MVGILDDYAAFAGEGAGLLDGWRFIVASYVIFAFTTAVKAMKTSVRSGIRIPDLWRMIKPIAKVSFTTGSTSAAIRSQYEVSDGELKVKPSFSSFFIPIPTMCWKRSRFHESWERFRIRRKVQ